MLLISLLPALFGNIMTDLREKRVVSVTVNNNNGSSNVAEAQTTTNSLSNSGTINQPGIQPSPTTTAVLQALTLNNLTRTSGDNCVPSTTIVSHSSAATKSVVVNNKHDFCVKVIVV